MRVHRQEQDRLDSVRSYEVLDTAPEPGYDATVKLAAQMCKAPIALISLIDEGRQWFKAAYGTELKETPREFSFCSDAVADEQVLIVKDARLEPRYMANPLVTTDGGVVAYAGVPLVGRDGLPLGALCVLDRRPRRFTPVQIEALRTLADDVVARLELRRVDRAAGRPVTPVFTEATDPVRLRRALEDGELRPQYQPIVDLGTGRTRGFEALLRWYHPLHGMLPPAVFLPAIESSRLILPVGRSVIEQSISLLGRRVGQPAVPRALEMAVNVSGAQLQQPGLARTVFDALDRHGVSPDRFTVEVTETVSFTEGDVARIELAALRDAGVRVALDDYGVGWSALGRLLDLPLTDLKLDRSLVSGLPGDRRSCAIARSTLDLASDMGLNVICEGVETAEQRAMLVSMGAEAGQGWLFSPALDEDAIAGYLSAERAVTVVSTMEDLAG